MTMKTIILIPSRLASTRLPNKPLKDIGGVPMIIRVLDSAQKSDLGRVAVVTPDQDIGSVVESAGGEYILTKNSHISGTDRIMEALHKVDPNRKFDTVVNLQGDIPFIPPNYIKIAVGLLNDEKTDIGTLISPLNKNEILNPNVVKVAMGLKRNNLTGRAVYFSRLPVPYNAEDYYQHIGIYTFRRSALEKFCSTPQTTLEKREKLEQLRALELGMNIYASLVSKPPIGVDTKEDLEEVRKKLLLNDKV
ncbi:MAG: 3-deoxy-manno-octulosonate cytidylyltransferase [Rhodospirillaceae bacterium]|nr:3-deoxy-manno-octulosonate cytidylyltransferase [Rhodospirillaceae bacterium]